MEFVRKGKVKTNFKKWIPMKTKLIEYNVEKWLIESLEKITYIFPKAHACAYVMSAFAQAFFKLYHPTLFFLHVLNKNLKGFENILIDLSPTELKFMIKSKNMKNNADRVLVNTINILLDIKRDNIPIHGVSLLYSNIKTFNLIDNVIYAPFVSIKGLGSIIATRIIEERKIKPFVNQYDLKYRANLGYVQLQLILKHTKLDFDIINMKQLSFFE